MLKSKIIKTIFDNWDYTYKIKTPSGSIYETFWSTVVESPQWKEWEKYAHKQQLKGKFKWDYDESRECGWISAGHFQDFLKFIIRNKLTKTKCKKNG